MAASVMIAWKDLDAVETGLELVTPDIACDRWIIRIIAETQEETWIIAS